MRSARTLICVILVTAAILSVGYYSGQANANEAVQPAKIGVVSIRTVLEKSKKNTQWEEKMTAEGDKASDELKGIQDQLKTIESEIKAFKMGTTEYSTRMKSYMEKKSLLDAKDKYYQQEFAMKQQVWAENLFQQALEVVKKVAKDKGIDVVLAKEDYEFPSASANELMLTIKTSKVLYFGANLDLTADVIAALDATD